ncbi:hypothetical protein D3C87_849010 [compost metagenome]
MKSKSLCGGYGLSPKNVVAPMILLAFLVAPSSSHAFIPMPKIDVGMVGAKVLENAQKVLKGKEVQAIYKGAMEMKKEIAAFGIENGNATSVIEITAEQQRKEEVSKLEELKSSQPGINSCVILASVVIAKEVDCTSSSFVKGSVSRNVGLAAVPDGAANNSALKQFRDRISSSLEESRQVAGEAISGGTVNLGALDSQAMIDSPITPFYLLTSDKNYYSLTGAQKEKMQDYILLVAPPYTETKQEKEITDLNDKTAVKTAMKRAMMNVPNMAFNDILSLRVSSDDSSPSKLYSMHDMANSYYSFEDFGALDQNKSHVDVGATSNGGRIDSVATRISLAKLATPDSIWRTVAAMKAVKINAMLESYKIDINKEILMATMLAKKINMM